MLEKSCPSKVKAITPEAQSAHLNAVSRTFALTIPLLPPPLCDWVANAYLLCRIADTMEDDPLAAPGERAAWLNAYAAAARTGFTDPSLFAELHARGVELVKAGAVPAELSLMQDMLAVVARTAGFAPMIRNAIGQGVCIMSRGMARTVLSNRIDSLEAVDHYCYFVAGVVGEVLASLFSSLPGVKREALMELAVSFGEGLQLTNILKDRRTDLSRGISYLPGDDGSGAVLRRYAALALGHLDDARDFVLRIPSRYRGLRRFCLLNIAMAAATLKKVLRCSENPAAVPKISRRKVKCLYVLSRFCCGRNFLTRLLYAVVSRGLKRERRDPVALRKKVSCWVQEALPAGGAEFYRGFN